jgi:hypothetical protein
MPEPETPPRSWSARRRGLTLAAFGFALIALALWLAFTHAR